MNQVLKASCFRLCPREALKGRGHFRFPVTSRCLSESASLASTTHLVREQRVSTVLLKHLLETLELFRQGIRYSDFLRVALNSYLVLQTFLKT